MKTAGIVLLVFGGLNLIVLICAICANAEGSIILQKFLSVLLFLPLGVIFLKKADQKKQEEKDRQKWENGE